MTRTESTIAGAGSKNPRQSIEKGVLAPGVALTPGRDPFPLSGQRAVRGWLVIGLLLVVVADVTLACLLLMRSVNRTARVAPSAAHVGAITGTGREITDIDAKVFAIRYVSLAENWSYDDLDDLPAQLRPYLHNSLLKKIEKQYIEAAKTSKAQWQHRTAIIHAAMIGARNSGIITIGVAFDVVEQTGQRKEEKKVTGSVKKVALIEVVQDAPTTENPQGLLITSYNIGKQEDWLRAGYPPFWDKASR